MSISAVEISVPGAEDVMVTDDTLSVDLSDGRTILVPLAWFPRLLHATKEERNNWRLIGRGRGIHWEGIDEDISTKTSASKTFWQVGRQAKVKHHLRSGWPNGRRASRSAPAVAAEAM